MTRIIDIKEVINIGGIENAIYCTKDEIKKEDLLIAQSETIEDWYDVSDIKYPSYLKTGYTMYILTKHIK